MKNNCGDMNFLDYQKNGHRDVIQKYPGINSAFINAHSEVLVLLMPSVA